MANNSATVTVRMWPSPCPAKASKLSRKYKSCKPGKVTVAGVRSRRRNASVSLFCAHWPYVSLGCLAGGCPWLTEAALDLLGQIPAVLGDFACHLRMGRVAFNSIGFGQSVPGSK